MTDQEETGGRETDKTSPCFDEKDEKKILQNIIIEYSWHYTIHITKSTVIKC